MAQDSTNIKETIGALDDYVLLGRSGLRISPLSWRIDTANAYNFGEYSEKSEQFLGEYIADKCSQVVIATKYTENSTVLMPNVKYNPNAGGNHRKSLVENLDESIKRLGTGYIDLMYVHAWEFRTPIEEVMRSLDDVVRSGKVLYIAISDAPAWVVSCANTMAELRGWSQFIGLQTTYNLLNRSLEYELQTACAELDVGIIPWGCIAEGFLTGKYTRESVTNLEMPVNIRTENEQNWKILDEVIAIAAETRRTPVQVALNWISQKTGITSPIIGARTKAKLVENLGALEFKLTPEQMARLDTVSAPKEIPFRYSIYSNLEQYVGKGIQIPDKYKPVFMMGAQEKL
ncbi:34254_t:CDS:10 [Racocetra persica]|uniref:34254_t:CDS:1 n=1 Tax=Racocetra persica TaxID=160502 RepID=A0ACA9KFB1_9GLOM|nr:34254_t:CDS:10 [Racocetra persica]